MCIIEVCSLKSPVNQMSKIVRLRTLINTFLAADVI